MITPAAITENTTVMDGPMLNAAPAFRYSRRVSSPPSSRIGARSDSFATIFKTYRTRASCVDYVIDQAKGALMFGFNGRHEVHDAFGNHTFELTTVKYGSPVAVIEANLSARDVRP